MGLFFKFALVGYSFMGYCFMATAGIIVYFDFLKRRAGRSIFRMLYNFSLAALTAFLLVFAVTEAMIVRYSLRQSKENLEHRYRSGGRGKWHGAVIFPQNKAGYGL